MPHTILFKNIIKSKSTRHIFSFIIFFFCAVYITYPLIFHMGDMVTGFGDEMLIAWIQSWVQHQLLTNPFHLFQANIFYPFIDSLAYSDAFITSSLISWIPVLLIRQPIVSVNFTLISSIELLGFSIYLLSYYLTKDWILSLVSGFIVVFSPAVLSNYIPLQTLSVYWVPLAILFFLIYLKNREFKNLIFCLICFDLQALNRFIERSIFISLVVVSIFYYVYDKRKVINLCTKKHMFALLISCFILLPIIIPYYQVSQTYHYVRDIRDTIHFALQPEDLLVTNNFSRLQPIFNQNLFHEHIAQNAEIKQGFLGGVFTLLVVITFWYFLKKWKKTTIIEKSFITISLLGFSLSFWTFSTY